jgi:hypothetical protein
MTPPLIERSWIDRLDADCLPVSIPKGQREKQFALTPWGSVLGEISG